MVKNPQTRFLVFGEALLRYHVTTSGIMSHTARRLQCCLTIAQRYIPDLKRRPGSALMSLWFRIIALYMEAFNAYMARGDLLRSLMSVVAMPVRLVTATAACIIRPPSPRGSFLDTSSAYGDNHGKA